MDPDELDGKPLPALRPDIEALPIEHQGKAMFVLHDTEGLSEKSVVVSPVTMLIASLLDGRITSAQIRSAFAKATGSLLKEEDLRRVLEQLGKAGLLDTDELRDKRRALFEAFRASPTRPARFAGTSYPKATLELAGQLGGYFRDGRGPGSGLAEKPTAARAPLGIAAPHIDFPRGGPAYAWAYRRLSEAPPPDVIVALGVAHESPNSPWVMTKKAYETPWGPMKVDETLYKEIAGALWYDPAEDEWAHRKEHSLEFQAVWSKFLWRDDAPAWVPILCSNFERFCPDRAPSSVPTIEKALVRIGELLAETAKTRRVLVLAGIDLAHVGPKFGDDIEMNDAVAKKIEEADRASLEHALKLDADPFYLAGAGENAWRKVCGLSAMYTSLRWLKALGAKPGELLTYGQAPDPAGGLVSFTGLAFND